MALRCSLLGHAYGDSDVEREREEQGNEVVVTIREEQTCARCGKTKLVSENKEVTAIRESTDEPGGAEPAAGAVDEGVAADADGNAPEGVEDSAGEDVTGDGHDAEFVDEGPDDTEEVPAATREAGTATEDDESEEIDPADDDAVILDADDEPDDEPERDRGHGEWPDSDDTRSGEADDEEWPAVDGEDEGFDAESGSGEPEDVEFGGGLRPESGGSGEGEAVVERPDTPKETTFTSVDSAPTPVESTGSGDGSQYVCPECGFTAPGSGSSLRAGDICPECRSGYLAER